MEDYKKEKKTVLITGGAGFVGHHSVEHILKNTNWNIVVLDSLNYAGNLNRLVEAHRAAGDVNRIVNIEVFDPKRIKFVWHDLRAPISLSTSKLIGNIDYCIHYAAESHVDRSLEDSIPFVESNVLGTANLLEHLKHSQPRCKTIIFSCYDAKTRAMTRDGFKYYWEVKKGDVVLSVNPKTGVLEEKEVEQVIIQDYQGSFYYLQNNRVNLATTPNHRIFYQDQSNKIKIEEAQYLAGKNMTFRLPNGSWKGKKQDYFSLSEKIKVSTKALFYLSGFFIGDGFIVYQKKKVLPKSGLSKKERDILAKDKKTGQFISSGKIGKREFVEMQSWRICFDIPEKDQARKKFEKTLEVLGIKYSCHKGKAGEHIYFSSREWLYFFEQFGRGAKNKRIPNWMLEYDKDYLEELFNGLIDSDGYRIKSTIQFTTVSELLVKGVCELGFKLGLYPTFRKRYSENKIGDRTIKGSAFCVYFPKSAPVIRKGEFRKKQYKGKIWCLKVKDNKNFVVEREGKLAFCGNTDEVFGPAPEGVYFKENDSFRPSNPYAGSKAGEETLAFSFAHAFSLPVFIVRSMNIIGERQHPEKFIPKTIKAILNNEKIVLHGRTPKDLSSRCWIHARNVADGVLFLLGRGEKEEFYHIIGEERTVLEMANWICEVIKSRVLNEDEIEWVDYHTARPGHDKRYALSGEKMARMGWAPPVDLEHSLKKTVKWSLENKEWMNL